MPTTNAILFSGEPCAWAELTAATLPKTNTKAKNVQIALLKDDPIIENKTNIPVSFTKHVAYASTNGKKLGFDSGEGAALSGLLRGQYHDPFTI
ncbi:hypothetical protein [Rhizobium sp. YK2]|uniref:hypothetical protein n=1 Tax=Rhizobium sp. YK2 TaxID=1860096 RepID=UPI001FDA17BF|nr:hypothetical protein [Rhizobium sp. YK2]